MKPFPRNPRTISAAELTALEASMQEFGDLGGIVHSLETDEIIGGNQRISAMNAFGVSPTITESFDPPTPQGTVAVGYILFNGERFNYRAVRWTPEQCRRANIIANAAGGHFDFSILAEDFTPLELSGLGLGQDALAAMQDGATELGKILNPAAQVEFKEYDESIADGVEICKCGNCGHEHVKKD
ncbi:MAG: hypothetical protein A2W25_02385 [candidate division Zixibacteria bacterium RBG_16_53_22]|nr:MAG: hypothetical protein A2W25_02385 [candidate division Zixibacteria bacterium RBG_16_53_22]